LPYRCTVAVSCSNFSFFTPNCSINQLPHISSTSVKSHSLHSHQITVDKLSATQVILFPPHPNRIPIALDGFLISDQLRLGTLQHNWYAQCQPICKQTFSEIVLPVPDFAAILPA
jgi:hypothetical protein